MPVLVVGPMLMLSALGFAQLAPSYPEVHLKDARAVEPALLRALLKDKEWKDGLTFDIRGRVTNLRLAKVSLSGAKNQEVVVSGEGYICGAANCITWILQKKDGRYRRILDAGPIQRIFTMKRLTNRYRDIETRTHDGASAADVVIWRYSGNRYRPAKCYHDTYEYEDSRGISRVFKRPIRKIGKCNLGT